MWRAVAEIGNSGDFLHNNPMGKTRFFEEPLACFRSEWDFLSRASRTQGTFQETRKQDLSLSENKDHPKPT